MPWRAAIILSVCLSFLSAVWNPVWEGALMQPRFLRKFTLELQEVQEMLESASASVLVQ